VVFTRELIKDILSVAEFADLEIALMDTNCDYLELIVELLKKDVLANGLSHVRIMATTDRRAALENAKYIFNVVRIGGLETYTTDIMIPLRYGIDQCVGDTLCAGGIMYGQRNIPFILDLCTDIKEVCCKDALLLNYANPMAMNVWAAITYGEVNTVGLCHGVQHGEAQIAEVLGLPKEELHIVCAGINHLTWYIRIQHDGEDLTGRLLEAFESHPVYKKEEKVRIDILKRFGYYCTESNGHLSEYVPWYRKRPEELNDWIDLGNWIHGETGGYLRFCLERRDWFRKENPKLKNSSVLVYSDDNRSIEHGSYILEALETGRRYRGHFNLINNGTISNLPRDACVEVPVLVDTNGFSVPHIGDLPLGPAAICNASISVQRLAVEAGVTGNDYLLRQAMLLDPLVGAVCNPPEVWQLVDEMLVAQQHYLPQYQKAIAEAKKRLATQGRIPYTRNKDLPGPYGSFSNVQTDERGVPLQC
jgi:alpha-galactosidase